MSNKATELLLLVVMVLTVVVGLAAFLDGSTQESEREASNLGINRRVVFYNGYTGEYVLTIEGLLSVTLGDRHPDFVTVTVRTGPSQYKEHYLRVADNVTLFCEQIEPVPAAPFHITA